MEVNDPRIYKRKIKNLISENKSTREDSFDAAQKAHITHDLISSLSTFHDSDHSTGHTINNTQYQAPIISPSPLSPMLQNNNIVSNKSQAKAVESANDEILAIQALGQLKNGGTPPPPQQDVSVTRDELMNDDDEDDEEEEEAHEEFYDTSNDFDAMTQLATASGASGVQMIPNSASTGFIMRNIKSHPLYNSALRAYRINKPTIKYGVEMVERAAIPMVNMVEQTRLEWKRKKRLRRANAMFPDEAKFLPYRTSSILSSTALYPKNSQNLPSISEALALGNKNLNEFSLNLSIESKKRIATCLQLLMLANKQLSSKIQHLQDLIAKEQELIKSTHESKKEDEQEDKESEDHHLETDNDDATTLQIKQEIVTTVKKVVSLISKYAGNSLPEPARSNVRQTLLRLPTKWATSSTTTTTAASTSSTSSTSSSASTSSSSIFNTNGKVLILANESLEMVSSVMSVFDETLTKAELWVKRKQEKQLAKAAILNNLHYSNTTNTTVINEQTDNNTSASSSIQNDMPMDSVNDVTESSNDQQP